MREVHNIMRNQPMSGVHRGKDSLLVGHDEGAPHVAVLHEAFPVGQPQVRGDLDGGRPRAVGDRYHTVYVLHQVQAPAQYLRYLRPCQRALDRVLLSVSRWLRPWCLLEHNPD